MIHSKRIIVSFTSWEKRIATISKTIDSILNQIVKPDLIELNLSIEEFPNKMESLPINICNYINKNNRIIEINWVEGENTRTFKKIIPTLKKFYGEDYFLLSIDDDVVYGENYINLMVSNLHKSNADAYCMYNGNGREIVIGNRMIYNSKIFQPDFWLCLNDNIINYAIDDSYIEYYLKCKNRKVISYCTSDVDKIINKYNTDFYALHDEYRKDNRVQKALNEIHKVKFPNMINFCIIHYNTPHLTECLVKSINKHTPQCSIFIFDNSDREPFTYKQDNLIVFDNTHGQIINFDEWLSNFPYRGGEESKKFVSAKHTISIDKCFDLIDDNFILMDSDTLLKKNVSPFWNDEQCVHAGKIESQGNGINRLLPFLCFINVKLCKKYNIRYFDEKHMHGLNKFTSCNNYDTGASFLLNTKQYPHKEINIDEYIEHYKGGSWDSPYLLKNKKSHGNLTQDEWLNLNKKLWSDVVNKKVIYTCITGDYEEICDPPYVCEDFDHVCFTDDPNAHSFVWKFRPIPNELKNLSKVKQQRCIKICPHKYLSEYDLSVWVDGSVDVIGDVNELIRNECQEPNKTIFIGEHPSRDCIYNEMDACFLAKKDTKENMLPQINRYKNENFPKHFGLVQSNIMIRKHNDPKCIEIMELWKKELINGSHRDQLSFNYCLWKCNSDTFKYLNKYIYNSKYFKWHFHKKKRNVVQYNTQFSSKVKVTISNLPDNLKENMTPEKISELYNKGVIVLKEVKKRTIVSEDNNSEEKTIIELPPKIPHSPKTNKTLAAFLK